MKAFIKKFLSFFLKKYRRPDCEGFIVVRDDVSTKNLYLYWRKDSYIELEIYRYGLYGGWERQSLMVWAYLSAKSEFILDVGANTGIYSLLSQCSNPEAKVIAIEPVLTNFDILIKNINKNNFSISAEQFAFSDYEGKARMFALSNKLNYMTAIDINRYQFHPEISKNQEVVEIDVDVKSYDYLSSKYGLKNVDLIKIDVEGHELSVLKGLWPLLVSCLPAIIVEIIGDDSARDINNLLSKLDYNYFAIDEIGQRLKQVDKLWDNDHQNFLVCSNHAVNHLRSVNILIS